MGKQKTTEIGKTVDSLGIKDFRGASRIKEWDQDSLTGLRYNFIFSKKGDCPSLPRQTVDRGHSR